MCASPKCTMTNKATWVQVRVDLAQFKDLANQAEGFLDDAVAGLPSTEMHYNELYVLQTEFRALMTRFERCYNRRE